MSAPSSSRPLALLLVAAAAVLLAAGCTVPGSSRLQGPPEDLPPSLDLVTADVLGFVLVDPDERGWDGVDEAYDGAVADLAPAIPDQDQWVGDAMGMALRELPVQETEADRLYFADVVDVRGLRDALRSDGWDREADAQLPGPGDDAELWTSEDEFGAAAVTDDALIVARTPKALRTFLRAADEYAVPERKAMSEFAVEAAERVPAAFVFRFDLVRTQLRRPFQHDPALLEFARWATDSNMLVALRDGWVGLAPPTDRGGRSVRVVGAAEWVPDLAPDIELTPAKRGRLGQLPSDVDVAVAIDDPGQQLRELVRAITLGAGQYVTEQDVEEGDERIELLPLLDALDGQAAIGYDLEQRTLTMNVATQDAGDVASRAGEAMEHVGLRGGAQTAGDGVLLAVPIPPYRGQPGASDEPAPSGSLDTTQLRAAGDPGREPFAWFWMRGGPCLGDRAGWLTFDGTDRMVLGMDVAIEGTDCASVRSLLTPPERAPVDAAP